MSETNTTQAPGGQIVVKPHVGTVVLSESTKAILSLGFGILAFRMFQSDAIAAGVIASAGVIATYVWGLAHRIRCWLNLRFLANLPQVPDSVAKVGK